MIKKHWKMLAALIILFSLACSASTFYLNQANQPKSLTGTYVYQKSINRSRPTVKQLIFHGQTVESVYRQEEPHQSTKSAIDSYVITGRTYVSNLVAGQLSNEGKKLTITYPNSGVNQQSMDIYQKES